MVEKVTREGEVVDLNPAGRVARKKCCDLGWGRAGDDRWGPSLIKISFFHLFLVFFILILPSVIFFAEGYLSTRQGLCHVPEKRHTAKVAFPAGICRVCFIVCDIFAVCNSIFGVCPWHTANKPDPVVSEQFRMGQKNLKTD